MAGSWSNPRTWVNGETITDVLLNAQIRDNLLWLGGTGGAITQIGSATGITSSPTTTSTASVDMTDMVVTLTTAGGSDVLVFFWTVTQNSGIATHTFDVAVDSVDQTGLNQAITASGTPFPVCMFHRAIALPGASHTFKGRWATSAGTATAPGGQRAIVALEVRR